MKGSLPLLLAALLAAGCGGGDDGDPTGAGTAAETTGGPPATARFESRAIGFTFEYPEAFAAQRRPRGQVLGQVSVEPAGRLNAIKVRRTSNRELRPRRYLGAFRRDFERSVGRVEQRKERIGALAVGVLEFEDAVERRGDEVAFVSSSYFFAGGGRTWQVECIADEQHRELVEEACATVLESVEFRGRGR